jgi:AcrR family transcriptional regulator
MIENELLDQAARTFAEKGFAAASLQDVADSLGITRQALYHYVRSKEDLLSKLVRDVVEGSAAEWSAIAQDPTRDPGRRLHDIAALIVRRRAGAPSRFLMLVRSEAALPPELARANETAQREMLRVLTDVVEAGVGSGQFRTVDPVTTAQAVVGMCNWTAWWFAPDAGRTPEQVAEEVADLALAMVVRPPARVPDAGGPAAAIALLREDIDYLEKSLGWPDA